MRRIAGDLIVKAQRDAISPEQRLGLGKTRCRTAVERLLDEPVQRVGGRSWVPHSQICKKARRSAAGTVCQRLPPR
jgi:hypothetical protein